MWFIAERKSKLPGHRNIPDILTEIMKKFGFAHNPLIAISFEVAKVINPKNILHDIVNKENFDNQIIPDSKQIPILIVL